MATTALPQQRTSSNRGRWIIAILAAVVLIAVTAALIASRTNSSAAAATLATTTVASGSVVATVTGSGSVAAAQSLNLSFLTNGTVTQVFVKDGDSVTAGQTLAQLDTRALALQVASAQAALDSATTRLAQLTNGTVTAPDLASAQAQLASAKAQLQQTRSGTTTKADLASAQAQLAAAQSNLDALKNPTAANRDAAQSKVDQAQIALQSTHTSASQTKTNAQLALQNTTNALTQAQSKFATAKQNWEYVQENNVDPANPTSTNAAGNTTKTKLNDSQRQAYYDAFVQSQAALESAQNAVTQAQVAYDAARQQEVSQVQQAEATANDAQTTLEVLLNPSTNDITQAQATVTQAQAALTKLQQGGTAAAVAQSQAAVTQAQAALDKLNAPATADDVTIQAASVTQAEQSLKQNQLTLEQATLKAPFAAVVTAVNIVPGGNSSASGTINGTASSTTGTGAISLIDRSTLHVDLTLSENDVAKVSLGQKVALTIDALKSWTAPGSVSYIAPAATTTNGVVTYAVRVSFPDTETRVKVGMTANLVITTDEHANVLLVPATALLPKGAGYSARIPSADGKTSREVDVTIGLTDGTNTEITSGLKAGDVVVTNASAATKTTPQGGLFGGG